MDKKVIVLLPNGRRHTVQVTPNTTLLYVLESACEKHDFNSEEYCLKHHRKEIGLTQMIRFSGLPNNCILEMEPTQHKREMKNVDICLQLENGERMQGQYMPTNNLLEVIESLNSEGLNACSSPVVLYMRQEVIGKENMEQTTLKKLGITSGRAMIRLVDKNPEELKVQANVYVAPKEKPKELEDEDKVEKPRPSRAMKAGVGFAIAKDLVRNLKTSVSPESEDPKDLKKDKSPDKNKKDETTEEKPKYDWGSGAGHSVGSLSAPSTKHKVTSSSEEEEEEILPDPEFIIIGERNTVAYSLESVRKTNMVEEPDSFYELTVNDLKLILRDLKTISNDSSSAPLQTKKMREFERNKQMLRKLTLYKNCIIRVQFPDRIVLQGMFSPAETIENVHAWIKDFLEDNKSNFHLYTIPPKTILALDKTLLDLDLVPSAILHFAYDDEDDKQKKKDNIVYLKAKFMDQLTSADGAIFAAQKFRKTIQEAKENESDNDNDHIDANVTEPMDIDDIPKSSRSSPKR